MIREKQIEENFINRLIELKYTYKSGKTRRAA